MPDVRVDYGTGENPVCQVGCKSFVFFRNPRPDATDPETGERYLDVIDFWVASEADKQALVQDEASPFSTTPHFNGHRSVLLRASRIRKLTQAELAELIQDGWPSRASAHRAATMLSAQLCLDLTTAHRAGLAAKRGLALSVRARQDRSHVRRHA